MKTTLSKIILPILVFFSFSACMTQANFGIKKGSVENKVYDDKTTLTKTSQKIYLTKEYMKLAKDKEITITNQFTIEDTVSSLAAQLMKNLKFGTKKQVLITSFVELSQLKKTTEFGRVVAESLINDLSNKGFNVIEFRGQLGVSINKNGEYFLSRQVKKLKDRIPDTYVVVGTYSRQKGRIILNSRVIDNISGKIISSARSTYIHKRINDCVIFSDCKPPRTIKIIQE